MSITLRPTEKTFFCTTMGAPLPWEVDVYFMRGRNTPQRLKPSDVFLPSRPSPPPTPTQPLKRKQVRPGKASAGNEANNGWFCWLFGAPAKPATTSVCSDVGSGLSEPKSGVARRRVKRHHDSMRSIVEQERVSRSSAFELMWSALFPTTHCKCCPLPLGHVYAQKCARVTYRKFNPADITCYGSVYGSDGAVIYWSRLVDDIGHYMSLTRESGAKAAHVQSALRMWAEVMNRAEKKLQRARSARVGVDSGGLPLQAGKCRMIRVPAPLDDGDDGCGEKRQRTIWVRCEKSICPIHGVSVVKKPKSPQTTADKAPRKGFDVGVEVGEVSRLRVPAPARPSQDSPLRRIVERDENEVGKDLICF